MIARIASYDNYQLMLPTNAGKTFTPEHIDLLKRWVAQGAEYKKHWSFVAPVRPEVPIIAVGAPLRNPIDAFVLANWHTFDQCRL